MLEWADACDGYKLKQRMGFRIARVNADEMTSEIYVETLESKDGTVFFYDVRSAINGKTTEEFKGRAELEAPGKGGTATFTKPKAMSAELPPGTVFPSEHTRVLVERAQAGERRVARTVFDGADGDTLYKTIAFVGKVIPAGSKDHRYALLSGLESWPVRIAYFSIGGGNDVPDYEIGLRLFANGIGDDVRLDYGDFNVRGELIRLEALPDSGC